MPRPIGSILSWEVVRIIIPRRRARKYMPVVIPVREVCIPRDRRPSMRITSVSWLRPGRIIWSIGWEVSLLSVVTWCSSSVIRWTLLPESCWCRTCSRWIMAWISQQSLPSWSAVVWIPCTGRCSWTGMVICSWMLRHVMTGHPLCQKRIVLISILLLAYLL